jgi:beta-1,2-mannobiose phosphorylase / 1,2-beta-oligomannan phosphorylase
VAVMCPHVLFDEKAGLYRMWYSGGEQYEPDAIGHATSKDGLNWDKHRDNPVFKPEPGLDWEKERVTACQVIRQGDGYLMFYIGFRDKDHAQIGVARSKDGITGWQRHAVNPIIRPGLGKWDQDAVYKPLCDLRRREVAPVVQRTPGRCRADRAGDPRGRGSGLLTQEGDSS